MIKKVVAVAAATGGLVIAGAGMAVAESGAMGSAVSSSGALSGNVVQAPAHAPAQLCGNTVNITALLNPDYANTCLAG